MHIWIFWAPVSKEIVLHLQYFFFKSYIPAIRTILKCSLTNSNQGHLGHYQGLFICWVPMLWAVSWEALESRALWTPPWESDWKVKIYTQEKLSNTSRCCRNLEKGCQWLGKASQRKSRIKGWREGKRHLMWDKVEIKGLGTGMSLACSGALHRLKPACVG